MIPSSLVVIIAKAVATSSKANVWVVMGVGSIAGGFLASKAAYRVGRDTVKRVVVVTGVVMTAALLIRLYL